MPELPERLMSLEETASLLAVPKDTLYALNTKGTGPRFFKVGRHCRYDPRDISAWLMANASRQEAVA